MIRILSALLLACLMALPSSALFAEEHPKFDRHGGFKEVRREATGWFRLERVGDRDMLITPDGHGFLAFGINHIGSVRSAGASEPDVFRDKYGSDSRRVHDDLQQQFATWGMNSMDQAPAELRGQTPYMPSVTTAKISKFYTLPDGANPYHYPDVFDPEVQASIRETILNACRPLREDRSLIGWFWTDTPNWDLHKTRTFRQTDWVSELRKLGPDAPGKQRYVAFLKDQYAGDIARFRRAYDIAADQFDDLLVESFADLDLSRYDVERDDQRFLGVIADAYYRLAGTATREAAPHHLILGEKYLLGDLPEQVLEAASRYVDVISIQPGDGYIPIYTPGDIFPADEIETIARVSGKPILICDHQIAFPTKQHPAAIWPYHQRPDETEAAQAVHDFILEAFQRRDIIGYMRCQYIDRFDARRQALKQGILQADGTPYEELAGRTRDAILAVKEAVRREAAQASANEDN